MNAAGSFGWPLVAIGLVVAAIGLVWALAPHAMFLGRLPGDIRVERPNFQFYFPLTTCLVLSGLLTLVLWFVQRFRS